MRREIGGRRARGEVDRRVSAPRRRGQLNVHGHYSRAASWARRAARRRREGWRSHPHRSPSDERERRGSRGSGLRRRNGQAPRRAGFPFSRAGSGSRAHRVWAASGPWPPGVRARSRRNPCRRPRISAPDRWSDPAPLEGPDQAAKRRDIHQGCLRRRVGRKGPSSFGEPDAAEGGRVPHERPRRQVPAGENHDPGPGRTRGPPQGGRDWRSSRRQAGVGARGGRPLGFQVQAGAQEMTASR